MKRCAATAAVGAIVLGAGMRVCAAFPAARATAAIPPSRGFPPHGAGRRSFLLAPPNAGIAQQIHWTPLAPANFSGRITAFAISPRHPDTMLAGAADGGIWRTTDGGAHFSPVFDFAPTLSIGSLAFDPSDPSIAYTGTGEANSSADSYPGAGVFKSSDAGATWRQSGLGEIPFIAAIAVVPSQPNELFAAGMGGLNEPDTLGGVFRSSDGGGSWTKVFSPGDSVGVIGVQFLPVTPPVLLVAAWERVGNQGTAAMAGARSAIYRSTDLGETWTKAGNGLPVSDSLTGRIALAAALSNPAVVYSAWEEIHYPLDDFGGIYRSTDAGRTWSKTPGFPGELYDYGALQNWYDETLAVNPLDPNEVLFGAVEMYRSTDGGSSWTNISNAYAIPQYTHPDQHAVAFDPLDTSRIFAGNDGGIYRIRYDSAWRFFPVPVTQFYSSAIDTLRQWFAAGGTQDNGLLVRGDSSSADWMQPAGIAGDVAGVTVNTENARTIYAEFTYGGVEKSEDGGSTWLPANTGIDYSHVAAVPPLMFDARDTNTLYTATDKIYRTTNGGKDWSAVSPRLPRDSEAFITALAIGDSSRLVLAGASDGTLVVSTDGGNTWNAVSPKPANAWVSSAAIDVASGALYAGYSGSAENLYGSTDGGATWQSLSSPSTGFPPAAVNSIVVDDVNDSIVIAGTDIGVFATRDRGGAWGELGSGLPHAAVVQLCLNRRARALRAATHGRALWEFDLGAWEQTNVVENRAPVNHWLALSVFPDPFTNTITLAVISPPAVGNIRYEIIDSRGAVRFARTTGERAVSFNAAALPEGVYFAQVNIGAWRAARLVLLVR